MLHAGYTTNSSVLLNLKFKFYSKRAIQMKDLQLDLVCYVCKGIYPITLVYYQVHFVYRFIDWLFLA